jgi:hypothetical protein
MQQAVTPHGTWYIRTSSCDSSDTYQIAMATRRVGGVYMEIHSNQTPSKSKENLDVLYRLTVQRPMDTDVLSQLNMQLQATHTARHKIVLSIYRRSLKWGRCVEGPALTVGQMRTDAKQKSYAMWFKQHMNLIRMKISEIQTVSDTPTPR